jgi:hypothetical protein
MLVGVIQSDLGLLAAAVSLLLGGIVVWGSNNSTAKEATKELAAAELERSERMASAAVAKRRYFSRRLFVRFARKKSSAGAA